MRVKGIPFQQVLLGAALLAALCWNLAHASEIKHLQVDAGATGTRAEVLLDREAEYKVISLSNPDRLVVDLPGSAGRGLKLPAAAGLVKAVRSGQPVPGTTRIVFDLAAPVVALKPHFEAGAGGTRLVLEWPGDSGADPIARIAAQATPPVPASKGVEEGPAGSLKSPMRPSTGAVDATPSTTTAPATDPAQASAAATSRLVAGMVPPPAPAVQTPAAVPVVASSPSASTGSPTIAPTAQRLPESAMPVVTTIATGVPTRIATGVPEPVTPPAETDTQATLKALQSMRRGGLRPLVVAIDPGHGGQDPGAIGMNGKREKDVTLAIGRELARQINASPGLKAFMTRDTDVFIPLNRRAQLARAAKADIFVSIHADAAENRSANGSSVYVLSTKGASSQRARWLADKENSADLIGGRMPASDNTLASVLLDLTQSGHMKASEDAAGHVLNGLADVGNNHKPHIERANFAVLRTSDMPSMLVETAFISNPDEERRLTDPAYQRTLARAVLGGIDAYFLQQPPPGTLYAARAQASSGGTATSGIGATSSNAAK